MFTTHCCHWWIPRCHFRTTYSHIWILPWLLHDLRYNWAHDFQISCELHVVALILRSTTWNSAFLISPISIAYTCEETLLHTSVDLTIMIRADSEVSSWLRRIVLSYNDRDHSCGQRNDSWDSHHKGRQVITGEQPGSTSLLGKWIGSFWYWSHRNCISDANAVYWERTTDAARSSSMTNVTTIVRNWHRRLILRQHRLSKRM